ncbi:MAG: ATP-binding protein [Bacillota bacterium]|jgi:predicted AAA+ superfamily ATPase
MYKDIAKLLLYSNLGEDSILIRLSEIFHDWDNGVGQKADLVKRIYVQMKRLLDLSTDFGFDNNLWHNYLTFLLITNENSFSLTCEKVGAGNGTVNYFAKNDFKIFKKLFDFDFSKIEKDLNIDCFSVISDYKAIAKKERMYNRNVSEKVRRLSRRIEQTADENGVFELITAFYKDYGVGMFGLNRAFRIKPLENGVAFCPINNMDRVMLEDLVGYELQKKQLRENTEAFVNGHIANNVLLYGDSGTGKSTSIKAIVNEYYDRGLRMIEIYKHQFRNLSDIIAGIKNRNYRFIIYMDDLSFEEYEVEYKFLKAVIEGGVETKPDNILIYATSNRRHLIKETWSDRNDMEKDGEIHRSDTMEEKLSLVDRFGVTINYSSPGRLAYHDIVKALAAKHDNIRLSEAELLLESDRWEMRHGGISGRTAQQFINYLAGKGR